MKPLTVYKASAGSGKTFTLAVEYIKLLIDNPTCFKNILAVTFTNKATEEMKMRILSQLYGIWKMLPESEVYTQTICDNLGITKELASRKAGMALNYLIHNYHFFKVETIDSFFQSILRNLARELDLTANLKIGLNDIQIEEQAVDQLIDSLNSTSEMLQWLIDYILLNINENKNWNIINQIKTFGRNIFKDFYKDSGDELHTVLSKPNFFKDYVKNIKTIKANAQKHMAYYASTFKHETEAAGLTVSSYANKSNGISSYFNKLKSDDFSDTRCKNKTLENCLADAENWASKTSPERDTIISLVNDKLMKLLHSAEKDRPLQWKLYVTADSTLKHLDKLRLLNSIEFKVRELNKISNLFLLSDTQHLLHTLIKDNDSPFIFEKTGYNLEHIMIDEFQDTSSVQWQNFKILLKEGMSFASNSNPALIKNLIVGDVKQSIYRWRSSDWRLLNNIKTQFHSSDNNVEIKTLQTNYRSKCNIVRFNNLFFKLAAKIEYEKELEISNEDKAKELLTAYDDVAQMANKNEQYGGSVRITLLPDDEYEDKMLKAIDDAIKEILKSGASENSIAILIRYNKHIPLIADYLCRQHKELNIVSDEAFRLDASPAVNIIINTLRLLLNPDNILTKASLAVTYQTRVLGHNATDILAHINCNSTNLDRLLPNEFTNTLNELTKKPLIDIIENIISIFSLDKLSNESAYIYTLCDQVTEFINSYSCNINDFLNTWDENMCSKTIQLNDNKGIRLISIHKSKGLEFDNVIIPFCDWNIESRDTILWCKPKEKPFSDMPIIPIDYTKRITDSIYAEYYTDEHIQACVDNLNLLYVAFTRASKNIHILGRKNSNSNCRSNLIVKCLPKLFAGLDGSTLSGLEGDNTPVIFKYGETSTENNMQSTHTKNVFLKTEDHYNIEICQSKHRVEFKQSNKSREFLSDVLDNLNTTPNQYIETGKILHNIFSSIRTTADIGKALKQLEFDGILPNNANDIDDVRRMLTERLTNKLVADWFNPHWHVFNECNIVSFSQEKNKIIERRPDRVITDGNTTKVIDFKFGTPHKEHLKQVTEYIQLLTSMGLRNVTGYIWYVWPNNIVNVNSTENNKN